MKQFTACIAKLLLWLPLTGVPLAHAELPMIGGATLHCVRSATLLRCTDSQGGYYGMAQRGNDLFLRGFDAGSGLTWAQTTTRHGRLHFFTGLSSDGNVWSGLARPFGWDVITRFSTSSGGQGRLSCNRLKGCD
ncbi:MULTISPECIES: hypothetical protein [Pseudomonas]|uniref:Glutamine synthetase n=1 Tax=Pseudomonas putida TaxID=303 RepID=A0A1B2F8D2_PSEPU|nr:MULTISPECIES: hypothetical protein [Pseudomonas]ANY88425.1 hypothetical protein IEC33019_2891 [Pseudomonas putida]MCL8307595.1 hypothetical protein [Pseudomonas putida]